MYNIHLETFLKVAALGSFSAAAETMYISPSAVIQQMNALEDELGAKLFIRTRKGVTLTEAGKYLHSEAADYIRKGCEVRRRLEAFSGHERAISIGTNPAYKVQLLYELWTMYIDDGGTGNVRLNYMTEDSDTSEFDIVEGIHSTADWQSSMQFEKLCEVPLGIGMRFDHPLAALETIHFEDLRNYRVLISKDTLPPNTDTFLEPFRRKQIYHEIVSDYGPNIVWESSRSRAVLVLPECRATSVQDIIYKPIDWSFRLEYGLFYHLPFAGPERGLVEYMLKLKKHGRLPVLKRGSSIHTL